MEKQAYLAAGQRAMIAARMTKLSKQRAKATTEMLQLKHRFPNRQPPNV